MINAKDYPNPEAATPKRTLDRGQLGLIQSQLLPGEIVCWAGSEPHSRIFRKRMWRLAAYSLWTGILGLYSLNMILLNPSLMRNSLPAMLPVLAPVGLAFLGAYLLGRELARLARTKPDLYAVTNRRALVISANHAAPVLECRPGAAKTAQVRRSKCGGGDILFERRVEWGEDAEGRSTRRTQSGGFFGVRCVEEALDALEKMG